MERHVDTPPARFVLFPFALTSYRFVPKTTSLYFVSRLFGVGPVGVLGSSSSRLPNVNALHESTTLSECGTYRGPTGRSASVGGKSLSISISRPKI
eukprot:scaffold231917_cov31-Tisochrysis_lutea.AAC.4